MDKIVEGTKSTIDINAWKQKCYDAMNDDFNSPILISQLFEAVKFINLLVDKKESLTKKDLEEFKLTLNAFIFDVLGLENVTAKKIQINFLEL